MPVQQNTPYIRSLTNLRRTQRPDNKAGKSGKKGGRPGDVREFPLLPVFSVNDDATVEEMQMNIGAELQPEANSGDQNNYSETIQNVISESVRWSEANPDWSSLPTSSTTSPSALPDSASRLLTLISPALPATALQILSLPPPTLPPSTLQASAGSRIHFTEQNKFSPPPFGLNQLDYHISALQNCSAQA